MTEPKQKNAAEAANSAMAANPAMAAKPAKAAETNKPQVSNADSAFEAASLNNADSASAKPFAGRESGPDVDSFSKKSTERRYSLHSAKKPQVDSGKKPHISAEDAPFIRAENEDDDGYDPYSDRRPHAEPLFERDPWD